MTSNLRPMFVLAAVAILVGGTLAAPLVAGAKPAKLHEPVNYYFHKHACDLYQQCYTLQPTDQTRPTAGEDSFHLLKPPTYDGVSWVTPSSQLITLRPADVVVVEAWADGTVGLDGTLGSVQVNLYHKYWGSGAGWLVGSAPLQYVPGTGTFTDAGVVAGRFTATFTGIDIGPSTFSAYFRTTEIGGEATVRFDSAGAPSCLRINAEAC